MYLLSAGGGDDIDDEDTDTQYSSTGFESELSETSTEYSQSESIAIDGLPQLSDHLSRMMSANIQEFSISNVQKWKDKSIFAKYILKSDEIWMRLWD